MQQLIKTPMTKGIAKTLLRIWVLLLITFNLRTLCRSRVSISLKSS